jgi:hypothetical protein
LRILKGEVLVQIQSKNEFLTTISEILIKKTNSHLLPQNPFESIKKKEVIEYKEKTGCASGTLYYLRVMTR